VWLNQLLPTILKPSVAGSKCCGGHLKAMIILARHHAKRRNHRAPLVSHGVYDAEERRFFVASKGYAGIRRLCGLGGARTS
jgi:hypothetical protein